MLLSIAELGLSRLPYHQTGQTIPRVLRTIQARHYNNETTPKNQPEGEPQYTEIPVPPDNPVAPPSEPEVPKIDRSRPLPPPAYARSRLGHVTSADDQELKFYQQDNQSYSGKLDPDNARDQPSDQRK